MRCGVRTRAGALTLALLLSLAGVRGFVASCCIDQPCCERDSSTRSILPVLPCCQNEAVGQPSLRTGLATLENDAPTPATPALATVALLDNAPTVRVAPVAARNAHLRFELPLYRRYCSLLL